MDIQVGIVEREGAGHYLYQLLSCHLIWVLGKSILCLYKAWSQQMDPPEGSGIHLAHGQDSFCEERQFLDREHRFGVKYSYYEFGLWVK